jgi:hypothetical protein
MEMFVLIVGVVVLLWIRQYRHARRVTYLRALELSTVTGISVEKIEREILQRQMTPGDWARERGLDPLTFRAHGPPLGSSVSERGVPEPDWSEIAGIVAGDERRIFSCSGWTVSLTDSVNHPVSLYLTDSALYVSIKPDSILPKAEIKRWPKSQVVGCETAPQPDGGTRLMVAFRSDDAGSGSNALVSLGVELRPVGRGSEFGDHVVRWFNAGDPPSREAAPSPPGDTPAQESVRKKGRLPSRPERQ